MAVGTALAIAAGAQALGGLFKAKTQSSAAKKAAQDQVKASNQAANYMQQGMGTLGQLYAPYINAGAGAQNTLSRLTTPGPGARFASPGPPNAMPPPYGMPPNQAMPRGPGFYTGNGGQGAPMRMPDGRQVAGPYPMAEGGDFNVAGPTMFLAGEAGPERATFQPQGGGGGDFGSYGGGQPQFQPQGGGGGGDFASYGGGQPQFQPPPPQGGGGGGMNFADYIGSQPPQGGGPPPPPMSRMGAGMAIGQSMNNRRRRMGMPMGGTFARMMPGAPMGPQGAPMGGPQDGPMGDGGGNFRY